MGIIKGLENNEIRSALEGVTRQYFVGNLKKPQVLHFFKSEALEIGITSYNSFSSEPTHRHSVATEYQYMISGRTQYMDVDTGNVYEFVTGDFYEIEPNTAYAQKSKPGTEILFIKVPSVNDKEIVEVNEHVTTWLNEKLYSKRTDFYYAPNAPKPNSIKPAAAVAIVKDKKILLLKRRDNGKWTMPGGTLEFGENLASCAIREVMEESGLKVEITDIIGTYTDPNILVAYSDGEVRQEFTVVYAGKFTDTNISLDEESTDYRWVDFDSVNAIELADSQRKRIYDVIKFYESGDKNLG